MRTLTSPPRPRPIFACLPSQQVLDHVAAVIDPESLLSGSERTRAEALVRQGDRCDFIAARVLTRLLLRLQKQPNSPITSLSELVLTQSCARCGEPHGRPHPVLGAAVSWAHAGGHVAAAVGEDSIGVDVEPLGARADRDGGPRTLLPWVRGEAIVKWGHGSVDQSMGWGPLLGGGLAPRGRSYVLDLEGRPLARRRFSRLPSVVITDAPVVMRGVVCSVAAHQRARWVDPLQ